MKKLLAFIFICSSVLLTDCKKYPEGPALSLLTKKARIVNTWKIDKYLENDTDLTTDFKAIHKDFTFLTTKEDTYTITRVFNLANASVVEKGNWALTSNKKNISLTPTSITFGNVPNSSTWQIRKLYEKELWVINYDSNGKKIEYRFIPA